MYMQSLFRLEVNYEVNTDVSDFSSCASHNSQHNVFLTIDCLTLDDFPEEIDFEIDFVWVS